MEAWFMRPMFGAVFFLLLTSSTTTGQSLVLQGAAGPTINDSGYSLAAGIGFAPTSRLTVLFGVDRTHLVTRVTTGSAFRGGTFTLATGELRATFLGHDRVSPYALAGAAAGVSRPNVNPTFPNRVTNRARGLFFGGGIHVPLRNRLSVFGDIRMIVGVEGDDGLVAVAPVRAGVAWRF
jgi:hypothetical protein